jgi:hypothetical protein
MSPPVVAEALLAATSPPSDYESIAGDLHEEYLRRVRLDGEGTANRWYWSQVLLSVPSLLSYSRARRSALGVAFTVAVVIAVLLLMMLAVEPINVLLRSAFGPGRSPLWAVCALCWIDAAAFGAILAAVVRGGGMRLALATGALLVLFIVVPTLMGFSSRLPLEEWMVLFGAVPAMCGGAGIYQVFRRHFD